MLKKTSTWIIIFSILAALGAASFFFLKNAGHAGTVAEIYIDGELYDSIDLSAVAAPYTFTIETERGENTVEVKNGSIAVTEADCPDQICVHQGFIHDDAIPIVCMPHRLVIQIAGEK